MDKIKEFMSIAEEKIGILLAKRLFCVLLLLFEIDRKIIVEKFGVSRLTVKKYGALIESGNIQAIFADTVYLRRSEEEACGLKRSLPQGKKFLKKWIDAVKSRISA
ncbi:MAG: hypothetical protein LBK43_09580 [Treponema sp.]|jgi:hypothetical protein|nr:hypothetical protein [Treponema sp.]